MVTKQDLDRINELWQRYREQHGALRILNGKPRIVSFVLAAVDLPILDAEGNATGGESEQMAGVSAEGIAYPPQMLDAIKQQVHGRIDAINKELTELGVTVEQESC